VRDLLIAFLITALPERAKREGVLRAYSSTAAHVASGAIEAVASAAFFIVGMIFYVSNFSRGAGWEYLVNQPNLDTGHFMGVGALGFLSYLFQPLSLLLVYCYLEGIVRALDAAFSDSRLGLAVVSLVWRTAEAISSRGQRLRIAAMIGPRRPDEIVAPEASRFGMLEIYSVEEKPWREVQTVEFSGRFFQLAEKRLSRRGEHHAWRYLLRELEEREVIRGTVVRYATDDPSPIG